MSTPEEWCREKLANLEIKDRQKDTLTEMKEHLITLPAEESQRVTNFLRLPAIFHCLESGGTEQTKLTCDVLEICMNNLIIGESLSSNSNLLENSLNHQNPEVVQLGLNELLRIAKKKPSLITDANLVVACVRAIDSSETKVGTNCIELLTIILPNFIDNIGIKTNIDEILSKSEDTVKCRIFEIGVNMAKGSPVLIEKLDFILRKMINDFNDSTDILFQLNVLEMMSDLATTDHGLVYLENKGVCANLFKKIETCVNPLMIPGLMKFFGSIAFTHPQTIYNKYPGIVSSLLDCIITNDVTILPSALDTVGFLGRSSEGKMYLNDVPGDKIQLVFKELASTITSFPSELKIRALNALELLFYSDTPENNQIASIAQSWYGHLSSGKDLNFLIQFTRNSFPDIKTAGIKLLKAVVGYYWGQEYLNQTAGFIEVLLDRKIEFDKNVLHEKFEVNKMLSESKVLDADSVNQLKRYVREGAFFVETIVEVAVEGRE